MAPTIEEQIVQYALNENNYEKFAELLCKILPAYSKWQWGVDSVYRRYFNKWQQNGASLLPNHFYSPVPDMNHIKHAYDKRNEMYGVDLNDNVQIHFIETVCPLFIYEYATFPNNPTPIPYQFHFNNGSFERVDAEILHCMVRIYKPRRIIEIGSGYSTLVTAAACELNRQREGVSCQFEAIEPFPNSLFRDRIPGLSLLITEKLQNIEMSYFDQLGEGDILFIDSTHVLKTGSDVQLLYLDIIPRLRPGVVIHIHDIFLPHEYPLSWLKEEHIFWNEQYILQSFLAFNNIFRIIWAGSYMQMNYREKLTKAFPGYSSESCMPGSLWITKVK
jgi:hypothetical protein